MNPEFSWIICLIILILLILAFVPIIIRYFIKLVICILMFPIRAFNYLIEKGGKKQ